MKLLVEIDQIRNQEEYHSWGVDDVKDAAEALLPKLTKTQKDGLRQSVNEFFAMDDANENNGELLALIILLSPDYRAFTLSDFGIGIWEQLADNELEWCREYVRQAFSAYDVETRYFVVTVMENFSDQDNYHNVLVSVSASDVEQRMPLIQALAAMMPRNGDVDISNSYGDRCFEWDSGYIYRPMDSEEITEHEWNVVSRFCPSHLVFTEDELMGDEDWIEIAHQFLA